MEAAGGDLIRKYNALLSYHFKIPDPENLSDEVYSEKVAQLVWVLAFENKRFNAKADETIDI
jgi:hypothetical protein